MPNTLVHLGTQGLLSTAIVQKSDLKWVFLGCIIPDIPWIVRRFVLALKIPVSLYDLQLYSIVQSSLVGCLFISIALATFSINYKKVFIILFLNSIFHLLIDSLQIKWANGVHLLAPFSWQLVRFDFFWPESIPNLFFSSAGLLFIAFACLKLPTSAYDLIYPKKKFLVVFSLFLIVYLLMPFFLISKPAAANNQFINTLRDVEFRQGRELEVDRRPIYRKDGKCVLKTLADEELFVKKVDKDCHGIVSVKAVFLDQKTIHIVEMYRHWGIFRDILSYLGLLFIGFYWLRCLKMKLVDNSS